MGCDLRGDGSLGWGGDGCLDWHCLNCDLIDLRVDGSLGWGGDGCLDWHWNCDLGGFGGWAVIFLGRLWARGDGGICAGGMCRGVWGTGLFGIYEGEGICCG